MQDKVYAKKSHFAKFEIEYLGYWITRQGIKPLPKKVEALQNIASPKNKKTVAKFPWNGKLLLRHVDFTIRGFSATDTSYLL